MNDYEDKFRAIYNSSPDTIMLLDEHGFLDCNPATLKMFVCSSVEEFLGRHPSEYSPPVQSDGRDSREAADEKIATAYQTGSNLFEWMHQRANGEIFPAEVQLTLLKLKDGNLLQATVRDMTKRKKLEAQLNQSQKMEALGTLVGGIAHDFNNMLAGMTGNLYLAKKKAQDNPEILKNLNSIEELSFRAADIIKQLLTFARKDIIRMERISLNSFINDKSMLLRTMLPENINVNQGICSDMLLINGDDTQLQQVLMNLVNNARDALDGMDDPCISIGLKAFHADDAFIKRYTYFKAGQYAHLTIEDNGCGIPKEHIEHLFEPFFTTKEPGKGTGLGLAMVFGSVKAHKGFIQMESFEGKGSICHIYIPLLETKNIDDAPPQQKVARGRGETILLVDDESHILETGEKVLGSLGYRVLIAADGLEAVNLFSANQGEISLVIMDIVMPRLGGVKAVERIRKIRPDIKVIFSTAYDKDATLPDRIPLNGSTILSKPYKLEDLSKIIRDNLD
ncbi:MAG: ATP-binding protein [Mariprofundaceae bacterium]